MPAPEPVPVLLEPVLEPVPDEDEEPEPLPEPEPVELVPVPECHGDPEVDDEDEVPEPEVPEPEAPEPEAPEPEAPEPEPELDGGVAGMSFTPTAIAGERATPDRAAPRTRLPVTRRADTTRRIEGISASLRMDVHRCESKRGPFHALEPG